MNRKIILLNLALVALAGTLVWQLRMRWRSAEDHKRTVLSQLPRAPIVVPPAPPAPPKPASPAEYFDVAQRTLFSRDRNPTVIVEPPPPPPAPPPPKPLPQLPFYHGQMSLTAPVVVLSLKGDDQKSYHAGDEVGPFKVVEFDRQSITFEWEGKTVERKLAELRPKEQVAAAQQQGAPAPALQPLPPTAAVVKDLSTRSSDSSTSSSSEVPLGTEMGGGFRACATGDNSPPGTVSNGYRKVSSRGAMGNTCYWEQIK